ncbi:hypothetical protein [Psychrobacter sp. I-STPA10]|uniref:hypothetical protein n=1 Tax=Psychrobacter sp. I-STPA10 TaxID=2585769 RepID=UPI001E320630|nr:hypothetical protein [Psychrobacter sp. I-STPA10]
MKKITFFIISITVLSTNSIALAANPSSLSYEARDYIESQSLSALSCASNYSTVEDVRLTYWDYRNNGLYVRGDYKIRGFWGRVSGAFKATITYDGQITWMSWKEPVASGTVSRSCLN